MPNTQSAKKALRQSIKRAAQNRAKRDAVGAITKKIKQLALSGQKAEAAEILSRAYKLFDKAAKSGVIHRGAAARNKSRLTKIIK